MRIAVTGKAGQVVRALIERGAGHEIVALGRPELDLTNMATIEPAIRAARPDAVVSAAAYTAVDKAESEREVAFAVNALGVGEVARVAAALGVPLIHISTDYVFDGSKPAPYVESDAVTPLGVYGASKRAGEEAVLAEHPGAVILRTAWVYSPFGTNFVKTMLRLAGTLDEVGVVADQIGNPTCALDLADGVLAVAAGLARGGPGGIFHMTGSGEAVWADMAEAVFAASGALGGPVAKVRWIASSDYPTPTARPANSRLDCAAMEVAYGVRLPEWRLSLAGIVARLIGERELKA